MNNFKNRETLPFMNEGRWYQFFIESDGSNFTLTSSDLEDAIISASSLKLPEGYHVIDHKFDIHSTGADTFMQILDVYDNGQHGVQLPGVASFDYLTLYVFAHK